MSMFKPLPENALQDMDLVNRVASVMNGDISHLDPDEVVLVHSEVALIVNAKGQDDFIEVINTSFAKVCNHQNVTPEIQVYFIRNITDANVNILYTDHPWFKSFVNHFGQLLRKARYQITQQNLDNHL